MALQCLERKQKDLLTFFPLTAKDSLTVLDFESLKQ